MKDLQEATENICKLKGEALGMEALMLSILRALPPHTLEAVMQEFAQGSEIAMTTLLNSDRVGQQVIDGFQSFVQRVSSTLHR